MKKLPKIVNIYVQSTEFPNLKAQNNPIRVDMPLKTIYKQ